MRDDDKIQRQVVFMSAQIFDPQDTSGKNNTWIYNRAPEGYKFLLHSINVSTDVDSSRNAGIVNIYDGHEYTHWNIFPGVESRELLWRAETNTYTIDLIASLNDWECKEYTLAIRSASETKSVKYCIILWYYLQKMSSLETLYYAVIQPRFKRFKKAFRRTLSRFED